MSPICLDSSAWIEITHDGANAAAFAEALSSAAPIIISTITLYEISKYTTRVAGESATEKLLTFLHQYTIAPVTSEIATLAVTQAARHTLVMADALIYATTLAHRATLWTQDADFKDLPQIRYFSKIS